jgi:hypothetical protein
MKAVGKITILTILCLVSVVVLAQNSTLKIPDEVKVFIEKEMTAIALESADLNGDGTKDYILVTEKTKSQPTNGDTDDKRRLIILTCDKTGKLTLVARNDKIVYCRSCGDPFDGVEANRKSFTVYNYGGSWQRWGDYYQFNYSQKDRTWQLVLVEKISYDSHDTDKVKTKTFTSKKFGKINIAKFDPVAIH